MAKRVMRVNVIFPVERTPGYIISGHNKGQRCVTLFIFPVIRFIPPVDSTFPLSLFYLLLRSRGTRIPDGQSNQGKISHQPFAASFFFLFSCLICIQIRDKPWQYPQENVASFIEPVLQMALLMSRLLIFTFSWENNERYEGWLLEKRKTSHPRSVNSLLSIDIVLVN